MPDKILTWADLDAQTKRQKARDEAYAPINAAIIKHAAPIKDVRKRIRQKNKLRRHFLYAGKLQNRIIINSQLNTVAFSVDPSGNRIPTTDVAIKLQKQLKRTEEELDTLLGKDVPGQPSKNPNDIKRKKEKIAAFQVDLDEKDLKEDAKIHYVILTRMIEAVSKDPDISPRKLRGLERDTKRLEKLIKKHHHLPEKGIFKKIKKAVNPLNYVAVDMDGLRPQIRRRKSLQEIYRENSKAAAKAKIGLEQHDITRANDILARTSKEIIDKKEVVKYLKYERRRIDSVKDYEFSRNIFKKFSEGATIDLKVLEKQLKSLRVAIYKRNALRKNVETTENNKIKNLNEQILLKGKIDNIINNNIQFSSAKKRAERLDEYAALMAALKSEEEQTDRQIQDARQHHEFANLLLDEASNEADASKLKKQLAELKVAEKKQSNYRGRLEKAEKALLEARYAKKPKKPQDKKIRELRIKQFDLRVKDAKLAHEMMTALIQQAYNQKDTKGLAKQYKDLREGIGGIRKYRLPRTPFGQTRNRIRLETAQNEHLNAEIKRDENKKLLKASMASGATWKNLEKLDDPSIADKSAILARIDLKNVTKIKDLTIKDAELSLKAKQTKRWVENRTNDHAIGNAFLLDAQNKLDANGKKITDPSGLPAQFKLMKTTVADRNELTRQLDKEETRQLNNTNRIEKAKFEVIECKKKLDDANRALEPFTAKGDTTSKESIEAQSAVYAGKNNLAVQQWELEKLQRIAKEDKTFDNWRKDNAEKNEKEANRLLSIILDPTINETKRSEAQDALKQLKVKIETEKAYEETLAPAAQVKERTRYRENLEAAEEKILKNSHNLNLLAIDKLKKNPTKTEQKEWAKRSRELHIEAAQAKREYNDAKLIYDFSDALLQESIKNNTAPDVTARKLKEKFAELKVADKLQKDLRNQIVVVDKQLINAQFSSRFRKTKTKKERKLQKIQLKRQKKDLLFGRKEMHKLVNTAYKVTPPAQPNPTGLKQDCKYLSEGIGGRTLRRGSFGQERNRIKLDKYENKDLNNKQNLAKSERQLKTAEGLKEKHPKRYQKALEYNKDCDLLQRQSERRLKDAKTAYDYGKTLLANAVADLPTPPNPSKGDRLKALKGEFLVLKTAIRERNQFTKRLERIENAARKTEREDTKKIIAAQKREASLAKDLKKEEKQLSTLLAVDPLDEKAQKAIDKQQAKIEALEEKLANQQNKVVRLREQKIKNDANSKSRIDAATSLYNKANKCLLDARNKKDVAAAKSSFIALKISAIKQDATQEREDREKAKNAADTRKKEALSQKVAEHENAKARDEKSKERKARSAEISANLAKEKAKAQAAAQTPAPAPAPAPHTLKNTSAVNVACMVHPSHIRSNANEKAIEDKGYTLKNPSVKDDVYSCVIMKDDRIVGTIKLGPVKDNGIQMIAQSNPNSTPEQNKAFLECAATYAGTSPPDRPWNNNIPRLTFGDKIPPEQQQELKKVIFEEPYKAAKDKGQWAAAQGKATPPPPATQPPNNPSAAAAPRPQ